MRIGRAFGLAIALLSAAVVVPPVSSPTFAAGATCVNGGNYWAGYGYYSRPPANLTETPVGVSAYVRSKPGLICGNGPTPGTLPNKFTTAWVMLFNSASAGGLAQAGFFRARPTVSGSLCNYSFSEWHTSAGSGFGAGGSRVILFSQGCTEGTDKAYRVTRISGGVPSGSSGPVQMTVGLGGPGTFVLDTTPFDISIWSDWTPFYSGETVYLESDIPGSAAQPVEVFAMGIQSRSTGQFIATPCYLQVIDTAPWRYAQTASACDHIYVWTQ